MDKDKLHRQSELKKELKADMNKLQDMQSSYKLSKYGMIVINGKITTIDRHLKPKQY